MKKFTCKSLVLTTVAVLFPLFLFFPFPDVLDAGGQAPQKKIVAPLDVAVKLTIINSISPFYDDCQMILTLNGVHFGAAANNREVFMETLGFTYTPQINSWSDVRIEILLKGDFPLGKLFKVQIRDKTTKQGKSNKADWRSLTRINSGGGFKPGQQIACSGCLLGSAQGGRALSIGGTMAQIVQWTCEDIIFIVPNKPPGVYPMQLLEGGQGVSNIVQFKIN